MGSDPGRSQRGKSSHWRVAISLGGCDDIVDVIALELFDRPLRRVGERLFLPEERPRKLGVRKYRQNAVYPVHHFTAPDNLLGWDFQASLACPPNEKAAFVRPVV